MIVLKQEKKIQVLNTLVEVAAYSVERMTGHRDTKMRLGVEVGSKCAQLLDQKQALHLYGAP